MAKRKRPDRFVIGYCGKGECVYGQEEAGRPMYCQPMTKREAQAVFRERFRSGTPAAIYELVECTPQER